MSILITTKKGGTYPRREIIVVVHDVREKAGDEALQVPTKIFGIAALSRGLERQIQTHQTLMNYRLLIYVVSMVDPYKDLLSEEEILCHTLEHYLKKEPQVLEREGRGRRERERERGREGGREREMNQSQVMVTIS